LCTTRFDWDLNGFRSRGGVFLDVVKPGDGRSLVNSFHFTEEPRTTFKEDPVLVGCSLGTGFKMHALMPDSLVSSAVKRLFGVRKDVDTHQSLIRNQIETLKLAGLDRFIEWFVVKHKKNPDHFGLQQMWIHAAHPKKKLREAVEQKFLRKGWMISDVRRYVDYKLKPGELLPPDKQLRAIGEISESSAFVHGPLAADDKAAFGGEFFEYRGCAFTFIEGPMPSELDRAIDALTVQASRYRMVMICYSDDACIAVRNNGRLEWSNFDISACDASMFWPVFVFAQRALIAADPVNERVYREAFAQCRKPIRLNNVNSKLLTKSKKVPSMVEVSLLPGQYCLPSGFSGTTLMNLFAQVFNFVRMADCMNRAPRDPWGALVNACEKAGFIAKMIRCECIEDLQFLKHSWALQPDGSYKPYVNFGSWFKKFGIIQGQMPSFKIGRRKATVEERINSHLAEIIHSRANWGESIIADSARAAFPASMRLTQVISKGDKAYERSLDKERTAIESSVVSLDTIVKRYRSTEDEVLDFCDLLRKFKIGTHLTHPFLRKVFIKDEGAGPESYLPSEPIIPTLSLFQGRVVERFGKLSCHRQRKVFVS